MPDPYGGCAITHAFCLNRFAVMIFDPSPLEAVRQYLLHLARDGKR